MRDLRVYDFAIVGAGVSGLSLAWILGESALRDRSILLVDGVRDDDELRTLSFWSTEPTALEPLVAHRWRMLRFCDDEPHTTPLREHTYQTLFFADLQRETKARLATSPRNRILDGRVDALTDDSEGANLVVAGETLRARWVFDSRFRRKSLHVDPKNHLLEQHFHGFIVRAPRDVFDPAAATWLDFRAATAPGTGFFYVLPFSAREALVELVTLAPVVATPLLRDYLARAYDLHDAAIVAEEAGVSPMTDEPFAWRGGERIRRIGIPAGMLKPSTGYALTRILEDSHAIVRSLERDDHPLVAPRTHPLYRHLDGLLLEVWSETPAEIPRIFGALLEKNPIDRVLAFLDERATALEVLRLGLTLPLKPFLQALARRLIA